MSVDDEPEPEDEEPEDEEPEPVMLLPKSREELLRVLRERLREILRSDLERVLRDDAFTTGYPEDIGTQPDDETAGKPVSLSDGQRENARVLLLVLNTERELPFTFAGLDAFLVRGPLWPMNQQAFGELNELLDDFYKPRQPEQQKKILTDKREVALTKTIATLIMEGHSNSKIAKSVGRTRQRVHQVRVQLRKEGHGV